MSIKTASQVKRFSLCPGEVKDCFDLLKDDNS